VLYGINGDIGVPNGVGDGGARGMGEEGSEWIGGEWVREGFGRGLEARLEEVLKQDPAVLHA
jgi:hypothetical protein